MTENITFDLFVFELDCFEIEFLILTLLVSIHNSYQLFELGDVLR